MITAEEKEMLEMAAKAAGFAFAVIQGPHCFVYEKFMGNSRSPKLWNPLDDDGEAMRLAVMLDMSVMVNRVDGFTSVTYGYSEPSVVTEMHSDDPYGATRLSITRAAAEIGRSMK